LVSSSSAVFSGCSLQCGGTEAEAAGPLADAPVHNRVEALEGAAADEQDVGSVDLDEVLVRVLAAALRWDVGNAALDNLE
jgi:hypothetical protein